MYDRPTALTAATLLAVSPLFWFYGSVGLTYAGRGAVRVDRRLLRLPRSAGQRAPTPGSPPAILAWPAVSGSRSCSCCSPCGSVAVVVGVRRRPRRRSSGLLILLAAVLAWFVPMIWLTGGLERYVEASRQLADTVVQADLDRRAAPSRSRCGCRATCSNPCWWRSARWPSAVLLVPWYARRHGWGRREWFLVAVDGAAGARLHAGALRSGRLRADLPARARHPAVARAAGGAEPRRGAGAERAGPRRNRRRRGDASSCSSTAPSSSARGRSPRDFDPSKPAWRQTAERRGVRLDLQPHGGRAARARGGRAGPSWPRSADSTRPRTPPSSPSWATRARTRGCVTRCSTCRSTRSTSCGWATSRPATTRRGGRRR